MIRHIIGMWETAEGNMSYTPDIPRNSRHIRLLRCRYQEKSIHRISLSYKRTRIVLGILALCVWSRSTTIEGFSTPSHSRRIVQLSNVRLLAKTLDDDEEVGLPSETGPSPNHSRRRRIVQLSNVPLLAKNLDDDEEVGLPSDTGPSPNHSRRRRIVQPSNVPLLAKNLDDDEEVGLPSDTGPSPNHSRRVILQGLLTATAAIPLAAVAGKAELDSTGNLFTPKGDMLRGGSEAARGGLKASNRGSRLRPGQAFQSVYDTRFIAYLSRFLLNFDPAARAWWVKQGLGDSWEEGGKVDSQFAEQTFASFSESVEIGLADYFVGPYGSYSSVLAAKAGITASQPAISRPVDSEEQSLIKNLIFGRKKVSDKKANAEKVDLARNGILNLCALLKERYNSVAAKRQLAILFSFIYSPKLQPTDEIRGLLGEADNATVTEILLIRPSTATNEFDSRTSSRRGGGYSLNSFPEVTIEAPPALGNNYLPAMVRPKMKKTSRVLCIAVLDSGAGYTSAPQVYVEFGQKQCEATAVLDRQGCVEYIVVLDPGYGYGGWKDKPPTVSIDAPSQKKGTDPKTLRRAKAVAELEYEIVGVDLVRGGNGYAKSEPPKVEIPPPEEDPDWFLAVQELPAFRMNPSNAQLEPVRAQVAEMRLPDGNVAFSIKGVPTVAKVDESTIDRLKRDPLELLPSTVRPVLRPDTSRSGSSLVYSVRYLEEIPQFVAVLSPRYRAYDPVFGGVGTVPVTKGASALSASEYARLALSGALCTVVVRTALNPLELIKTKQQLQNDDELSKFARERLIRKAKSSDQEICKTQVVAHSKDKHKKSGALDVDAATEKTSETKAKVGTIDMVMSLIELRGFKSLFQSADITFLASIMFGSFGFGATELFRRSFTAWFSNDSSGTGPQTTILLFAAAVGTVVTAAAASPFEVLRVRSMGLLEPAGWTAVLEDFLEDSASAPTDKNDEAEEETEFDIWKLNPRDMLPLWSGFAPTLSRELPFAVTKFLTFDLIATLVVNFLNARSGEGALPVQVGVGPEGLVISAASGAFAGIAAAVVSHPADLILTYTAASKKKKPEADAEADEGTKDKDSSTETKEETSPEWLIVVKELTSREGGLANLYIGLPARSVFFFLVIGLQFFLYDYVKGLFEVGSDDLSLVLDVFYAVRAGLVGADA